jgi:hypothetical protein
MKDFRLGIEVKVTAKPVNHKFITPIGAPEEQNNFIEKLTAEANVVATDAELESKVADAIKVISRQWQLATDQPPRISNPQAYDITISSGSIKCLVDSLGLSTIVTLEYGSTPELGTSTEASASPLSGGSPEEVSWDLADLQVEQTIYYRIKAVSSAGTVYTHLHSFTTLTTPLALQFDYTGEEQFRFLFKAPATKSITLDWGDGTSETIAGANDTYIDRTSSYTQKKKYNFKVTGDVVSITSFRSVVPCYPFIHGDVSRWGEMPDIDTVYFGWPQNPCPGLYGDITSIRNWTKLVNFYITSDGVTGDLSQLDQFTTDLYIISVHSKKVRFANVATWDGLDGAYISLNYLSSKGVDNLIASTKGSVNCQIAAFLSEERTLASNQDLLESVENNNAVFVREDDVIMPLGDELHTDANAVSDPNGNEANATTGWVATGLDAPNEFVSQSSVKKTGSYAFKTNANPNPTSGAKITYTKTVEAGKLFRAGILWKALDFDNYRKDWELNFDGRSLNSYAQRDWTGWAAYVKASSTSLVTLIKEDGSANAGGVYIDSFSLREVITSPLTFQYEFNGTDQAGVNLALPSGSTVIINWGDGTTTTVNGIDEDTVINNDSAYTDVGVYTIFLEGDVTDLTKLRLRGNTLTGSIDRWGELTNLTVIATNFTRITGDVSNLSTLTSLTNCYFNGTQVYGDLSTLKTLTSATFFGITSPYVTWETQDAFSNDSASIMQFGTSLSPEHVDNAIASLKTCTNCAINLMENDPRTEDSNQDLLTLVENNSVFFVKERTKPLQDCDVELHTDANAISDPNGNETNAITGWTPTNIVAPNDFVSQSKETYKGKYAFLINTQRQPTSGAKIDKSFTVESSKIFRTSWAWRHTGEGDFRLGSWQMKFDGKFCNSFLRTLATEWRNSVSYTKSGSTSLLVEFSENGSTNDGGMYLDDFSFRKVINSPIVLKVEFDGTNQFEFDFKAPSTSTLTFYDGDGTITEVDGNDATEVTHTTDYSEPGVYTFYVEGDLSDITELKINNQSFVSGSINRFGELSSLIDLNVSGTGFDGNLENILNLTSLETFYVAGTKVTGDVSELAVLTSLDGLVVYQSEVFGDFSKLYPLTLIYQIFSFDQPGTSFENIETWDFSALATMQFHNNAWSSEDVDNCLISLANGGASGASIKLDGNNDTRTSASDAALSTLLAAGNTVIVNYNQSPIMFTVNYTDTQFDFKFKLPSTKTLIIHDGDGTITQVAGQDDTLVTHTTSYAAPGTYYFYIDGDYLDITRITCNNSPAAGSIDRYGELVNLTYLQFYNTPVSGNIEALSGLTNLEFLQLTLTGVTGDAGDLSGLINMVNLYLHQNAIFGDVSQIAENMSSLSYFFFNETEVTFDSLGVFQAGNAIRLQDCGLTSAMVDNALISFANSGVSGQNIKIGGNNAPRTIASDAAMSALLEDGNTVDVNFDSPVWFDVDYTDTQLQITFKLPATKYVEIHDGDGTRTVIQGQDDVEIVHDTAYASPGKYRFYIDGAVTEITYLDLTAPTYFVSGDVTRYVELTKATYLSPSFTECTGDVSGWHRISTLEEVRIGNSKITGNITKWNLNTAFKSIACPNLTGLICDITKWDSMPDWEIISAGNSDLFGDISNWANLPNMYSFNVRQNPRLKGDLARVIPEFSSSLEYCYVYGTQITFEGRPTWPTTLVSFLAFDCGWTPDMVDNALISLDDSGITGKEIKIAGKNASRTLASDDALISLLQAGNTVEVNYDSPVQVDVFYDGVNQFDLIFCLPSTDYVNIHDGDGTETLIQGQDSTFITHTTSYTQSGYYRLYVDGSASKLTRVNIREDGLRANENVSININRLAELPDLQFVNFTNCNPYGDILTFANKSMILIFINGGKGITGDIGELLETCDANICINGCPQTTFNKVVVPSTTDKVHRLQNNNWPSDHIDNALISFAENSYTHFVCFGKNPRTSRSDNAVIRMLKRGILLTVSELQHVGTLGPELYTLSNALSIDNEADGTTGWTPVTLDTFESQSEVTSESNYAIKADCNTTKQDDSEFRLTTPITVVQDDLYLISMDLKHIGLGDTWVCLPDNDRNPNAYVFKHWTEFINIHTYYLPPDTSLEMKMIETNGSSTGGIYMDNLSIKKVTLP